MGDQEIKDNIAEETIEETVEENGEIAEAAESTEELDERLAHAKHAKIGKHAKIDEGDGEAEGDVVEVEDTTEEPAETEPESAEPVPEPVPEPKPEPASEPKPAKEDNGGDPPNIKDYIIVGIIALILGIGMALLGTLVPKDPGDLPAATVNGTVIQEKEITKMVNDLRSSYELTDNDSWAQWLVDNGYTPESLRQSAIENRASIILIKQAAAENNVTVTEEEVEETWQQAAAQMGGEDMLREALASAGNTEAGYRENIELAIMEEKLAQAVLVDTNEITDQDVIEILKAYYPEEIAADATTLDGVDPELVDYIRQALIEDAISSRFGEWFSEYKTAADIQIADMPQDLSYNVSLEGFEPSQTLDLSSLLGGQVISGEDGSIQIVEGDDAAE